MMVFSRFYNLPRMSVLLWGWWAKGQNLSGSLLFRVLRELSLLPSQWTDHLLGHNVAADNGSDRSSYPSLTIIWTRTAAIRPASPINAQKTVKMYQEGALRQKNVKIWTLRSCGSQEIKISGGDNNMSKIVMVMVVVIML